MSLPVIIAPEDLIKLWSIKKPVRIRPYLVGEEKLLLMAQQANDPKEVEKAVKQIIRRCTFDEVNPETLPSFDIEWLFLQLRARSVNNVIEGNFRCQNLTTVTNEVPVRPKPCGTPVKILIDIANIKMTVPEGHTNKIWLTDKIGITLKYPTAETGTGEIFTDKLASFLDTVFTADGTVTEVSEEPPADVTRWVETLSLSQVGKIKTFFETMPRLFYTFNFLCPKCGYTEDITLQGLTDFFD